MAFSHHKLEVGGDQSAGAITTYLADPQSKTGEYYSESSRAPMRWAASDRAKAFLGLGDHVELWKVESLLRGQHPLTGELIRRFGPTQTMIGGIDVTLSPAPKSVSILWALADPELKRQIERMVVGAVAGAIAVMTKHVPLVRERYGPGKNDVRAIKANDVVAVQALHTTARLSEKEEIPDPQLHLHTVLFSDLREDGQLRAIDSLLILRYRSELDAEAQASLAWMLERAGFEIERIPIFGKGDHIKRIGWELKGIPPSLIEAMSGRSREIADLSRKYREETGRAAEGPAWERYVNDARGPKSRKSAAEMHAAWQAEAEEHGLVPAQVRQLAAEAEVRSWSWSNPDEHSDRADQLRREILHDLCRDHALVPERQLNALAQWRAIALLNPYMADTVVAKMFGDGDLLRTSEGQVTTLEVLAQEQRANRALKTLLDQDPSTGISSESLEREFDRAKEDGRPFDPGQREAIALAVSGARFVSIAGPAGTGKGHASRAMVNLWHEQGRHVYALAVAGRTAQQAGHDSGAEPITLDGLHARLQSHAMHLGRSDVLLVDEAAMIDHQRYANLLEDAAFSRATLVQVGDDAQLNPVGPGGLWTIFHGLARGQGTATELRVIHRAKNPYEAQAWSDLRDGRVQQALSWYRDVGQLRLYDTRQQLRQGMVTEWWANNPDGVMLVDTSNVERDELNALAQAKRQEAGQLGEEVFTLANGRQVRAGDRVLFADHPHDLDLKLNAPGARIENGTEATVMEVTPRSLRVELNEPAGPRLAQVDASAELELGYARHVNKGQGMTIEKSNDIATSEQTTKQSMYTLASRSREGTRIHALRSELEAMEVESLVLQEATHFRDPLPEDASPAMQAHRIEAQLAQTLAEIQAGPRESPHPPDAQALNELWRQSEERTLEQAREHAGKLEGELAELGLERTPAESEPLRELGETPMTRQGDLESLRMLNQTELRTGQVIRFSEQLPLREPASVELGEHGVVTELHRAGGPGWDYAKVTLVGGRQINVYQPDVVEHAPADVTPETVFQDPGQVHQRDPHGDYNLPLHNGLIVQAGDLVRFPETQTEGRLIEVQRPPFSPASRGLVELSHNGERVPLFGTSNVEIVKTGQEIAAEKAHAAAEAQATEAQAHAVEDATIQELAQQIERSEPKRAIGNAKMEPALESQQTRLVHRDAKIETRAPEIEASQADITDRDPEHLAQVPESQGHTPLEAQREAAREQTLKAAEAVPQPSSAVPDASKSVASEPEPSPEAANAAEAAGSVPSSRAAQEGRHGTRESQTAQAHEQMREQAGQQAAGQQAEHSAEPVGADHA